MAVAGGVGEDGVMRLLYMSGEGILDQPWRTTALETFIELCLICGNWAGGGQGGWVSQPPVPEYTHDILQVLELLSHIINILTEADQFTFFY